MNIKIPLGDVKCIRKADWATNDLIIEFKSGTDQAPVPAVYVDPAYCIMIQDADEMFDSPYIMVEV